MSHAPGLSGTPVSGQRSSAATRASCARSSARPTSRTIRVIPAMSLGASIRHTASMAPRVSDAVTRPIEALAPEDFLDHRLAVTDDLAETPGPLQGLVLRLRLQEREPAGQLLGLGERAVGHAELAAGVANAGAVPA